MNLQSASKILFVIGVLSSVCWVNSQDNQYDSCTGTSLCSKEANLVCGPDNECVCTYGTITEDLKYTLIWNLSFRKCFAAFGSACVGTIETPQPEGNFTVECSRGFTCVQVDGLPLGVGKCSTYSPPTFLTHGRPCNHLSRCNKAAGLVCGEDNTCTCTSGTLTKDVKFNLDWDSTREKCFAVENSACVGTVQTPNVAATIIECVNSLFCEEIVGLPFGVGVCKRHDVTTTTVAPNPSDTTTTPGSNPGTPTTPGNTTPSDAGKKTVQFSILSLLTFISVALTAM